MHNIQIEIIGPASINITEEKLKDLEEKLKNDMPHPKLFPWYTMPIHKGIKTLEANAFESWGLGLLKNDQSRNACDYLLPALYKFEALNKRNKVNKLKEIMDQNYLKSYDLSNRKHSKNIIHNIFDKKLLRINSSYNIDTITRKHFNEDYSFYNQIIDLANPIMQIYIAPL